MPAAALAANQTSAPGGANTETILDRSRLRPQAISACNVPSSSAGGMPPIHAPDIRHAHSANPPAASGYPLALRPGGQSRSVRQRASR